MPSANRLQMDDISKRFGPTVALDGVSFQVRSGEVHALVGENGAGKSTLMKILSGAYQADQGAMWLDDEPYQPRDPQDGRAAGVAMIYQELSLAPHLSIEENILLGVEPGKGLFIDWASIRQKSLQAMRELGLNHLHPETIVSRLSVAEQQLVELARAVAIGCRVLVLDEPTSSLTQKDIVRLFALIKTLKEKGYAVVYISHFLEEVKEVSDRYTVLRDGRVAGTGDTGSVSTSEIASLMVGRELEDLYPPATGVRGELLLEVRELRGPSKVEEVSLKLHRGEVLGIAGLVGAGRTELLKVIFGMEAVRSGQIRVAAFSGEASPKERWSQGVGMVSEDRKREGLALSLSVAENLTLTRLEGLGPGWLVLPSKQVQASRQWIERLSIRCRHSEQRASDLSGGNQQKVALARLLYHDVDVFLLDEPTRGIDVGSKVEIYKLIRQLADGGQAEDRAGKAVLMVSSYLPELLGVCDRIAVMCRGVLHPARPAVELSEHEIMLEATGTDENTQRSSP